MSVGIDGPHDSQTGFHAYYPNFTETQKRFLKRFSVFQISIDNFLETRGDLVLIKWKIVPLGSKRVPQFFYKVDETVKLTRLFLCSRCLLFLYLILERYTGQIRLNK